MFGISQESPQPKSLGQLKSICEHREGEEREDRGARGKQAYLTQTQGCGKLIEGVISTMSRTQFGESEFGVAEHQAYGIAGGKVSSQKEPRNFWELKRSPWI